jgi:hypothetical protein
MIVYHSGQFTEIGEPLLLAEGRPSRLLSYFDMMYNGDGNKRALDIWLKEAPDRLLLDSGAFSAYSLKKPVHLQGYCEFLLDRPTVALYAALDVIRDWRATAKNLDAMLDMGLRPVPIFQWGAPLEELDRLARNHPVLALGGLVSDVMSPAVLQQWLDRCWSVLRRHWPRRVHAFGVQAQWALERYPFYSTDSTTTIVGGGMGRMCHFEYGVLQTNTGSWVEVARATMNGDLVDGVGDPLGPSRSATRPSAHRHRRLYNLRVLLMFERYITNLWRARGVEWDASGAYTGSLA